MGSTAFVITLPLTWPLGGREKAQEELIMTPVYETFQRPVGEF
jgi:hypothetical protein